MAKIVVTEQIDPVGIALLKAAGHEVAELDMKGGIAVDPASVKDADALLVRIVEVTKELIGNCPNLKLISKHGVGIDNIDMDAAKAKGVAVTIAPGANSTCVAEHAFAMLIALAKVADGLRQVPRDRLRREELRPGHRDHGQDARRYRLRAHRQPHRQDGARRL